MIASHFDASDRLDPSNGAHSTDTSGLSCLIVAGKVQEGEQASVSNSPLRLPVALGRIVDPLGRPLDGRSEGYMSAAPRPPILPVRALLSSERGRRPTASAPSGMKLLDALSPLARGQSLVLRGQPGFATTDLAVELLASLAAGRAKPVGGASHGSASQEGGMLSSADPVFVLVLTGQSASACGRVIARVQAAGLMSRCVIVAAPSEAPAGQRYLAPLAGAAAAS